MSKAVIITSHVEGDLRQLADFNGFDYVICADGGLDLALEAGIRPHMAIGDFDSSNIKVPEDIPVERLPSHKDITDTAAALEHAREKGCTEVLILGGIGGRLDHTMANIQNIFGELEKGVTVTMADRGNMVIALRDSSMRVRRTFGSKISLFSFGEECRGVTISGVEYPLRDYTLTCDFPLGVSNEFVEDEAFVEVKRGRLLIILSQDGQA